MSATRYPQPYTRPLPLVVVVGETASGKSALGLEIAQKFDGEIICADSWTVRREVNIGTAKPSQQDRAKIPHHLLDVVDPCGDFTAAVFKRLANQAIAEIHGRGKLPVMVGGTGLYIDGVLYDFGFLPHAERAERAELNQLSIPKLRLIIKQNGLDDSTVDVRNKRRLIRLIETDGAQPGRSEMRPNTLLLGMKIEREELKYRIKTRTSKMLKAGLEREAKLLLQKYGPNCEALKGIGYKEWVGYFNGDYGLEEAKEKIISATLGLAKRQRTWFKRNKSIQWVQDERQAVDLVEDFLNNS